MARKTIDVTVEAEGRDKDKTFRITEMDSWAAEEWGMRALTIMNRSNIDIPSEVFAGGWLAVAAYGVRGILCANFDEAKPLLDDMMGCAMFIPSPGLERHLVPSDTEEITTMLWLRDKIIELHVGFSPAAALSNWMARQAAAMAEVSSPPVTPTSRKPSRRS